MRCDVCGSSDSLFVVVSGNSQGETRLCRVCALEKGYHFNEGVVALPQVDSILDQLDKLDKEVDSEASCPDCGMGQDQLVGAGRLGCPSCVKVFRRQFLMARKRRGLPAGYAGKIPRSGSAGATSPEAGMEKQAAPEAVSSAFPLPEKLDGSRLLADMESAVLAEDFEKAALLRDRLGSVRISGNPDNEA